MPELPDVEVYKNYFDKHALNKIIEHVEIHEGRVVKPARQTLNKFLKGSKLTKSERIGKNLLIRSSGGKWLAVHFGMTGDLKYFREEEGAPAHSQLVLHFENNHALSLISKRKFGKIELTASPEEFAEEKKLGPDALALSEKQFTDLLEDRSGMIKSALMDQKLIAGLGNVYVDEILFQSKIHPETQVQDLSEKEIIDLHKKMQSVLKMAIKHSARPADFPKGFLTGHRKEGAPCPQCSGKVSKMTVNGRGTYLCQECQQKH